MGVGGGGGPAPSLDVALARATHSRPLPPLTHTPQPRPQSPVSPLLHALAYGVAAASGVEVDGVKVEKAVAFAQRTVDALAARGHVLGPPPDMQCAPIESLPSLDPATHAYSFWEGVPPGARAAFGALAAASASLRGVAVVQRALRGRCPAAFMHGLGFAGLTLVDAFPVTMSGSGRAFTAYVFARDPPVGGGEAAGEAPRAAPARS